QVALHAFKGEVSYTDGNYLGNFNASLKGPAGAFTVVSPFSGNLQEIHLPQLEVVAGQGKASGHLDLQFADGIGWDTALDLSALDPSFWIAELPGTLAGPLRSKGQFRNEQLELTADLDLKGRLRGQPAVLQDNRLQNLALTARLDQAQRATLNVKGVGIQAGDTALGTLLIDAQGTLKAQQLKLDLQGPLLKLAIAI
ncbi:hypothetical protein CVE29_30345, partial [Pseudomonas syringae pv. actinidiae]|nr:hypothetical protein [Pseudomonas syringae pv. actinidiae]